MITDLPDEHVFTLDDSKAVRSALVQHVFERKPLSMRPVYFTCRAQGRCGCKSARMYKRVCICVVNRHRVYILYIYICMHVPAQSLATQ